MAQSGLAHRIDFARSQIVSLWAAPAIDAAKCTVRRTPEDLSKCKYFMQASENGMVPIVGDVVYIVRFKNNTYARATKRIDWRYDVWTKTSRPSISLSFDRS